MIGSLKIVLRTFCTLLLFSSFSLFAQKKILLTDFRIVNNTSNSPFPEKMEKMPERIEQYDSLLGKIKDKLSAELGPVSLHVLENFRVEVYQNAFPTKKNIKKTDHSQFDYYLTMQFKIAVPLTGILNNTWRCTLEFYAEDQSGKKIYDKSSFIDIQIKSPFYEERLLNANNLSCYLAFPFGKEELKMILLRVISAKESEPKIVMPLGLYHGYDSLFKISKKMSIVAPYDYGRNMRKGDFLGPIKFGVRTQTAILKSIDEEKKKNNFLNIKQTVLSNVLGPGQTNLSSVYSKLKLKRRFTLEGVNIYDLMAFDNYERVFNAELSNAIRLVLSDEEKNILGKFQLDVLHEGFFSPDQKLQSVLRQTERIFSPYVEMNGELDGFSFSVKVNASTNNCLEMLWNGKTVAVFVHQFLPANKHKKKTMVNYIVHFDPQLDADKRSAVLAAFEALQVGYGMQMNKENNNRKTLPPASHP